MRVSAIALIISTTLSAFVTTGAGTSGPPVCTIKSSTNSFKVIIEKFRFSVLADGEAGVDVGLVGLVGDRGPCVTYDQIFVSM